MATFRGVLTPFYWCPDWPAQVDALSRSLSGVTAIQQTYQSDPSDASKATFLASAYSRPDTPSTVPRTESAITDPSQLPKGRTPTTSLSRSRDKPGMRIATTNHLETLRFLRTSIGHPACSSTITTDNAMSKFNASPLAFKRLKRWRKVGSFKKIGSFKMAEG
jgi:hypothetical protein